MDEIIQESRMRKEEAAREREELERQRGELDEEFSNIFGELSFRPPKAQRPIERVEPDSYDKLMKEMIFDRKATATERVLAEKRFLCMWGKMEVSMLPNNPKRSSKWESDNQFLNSAKLSWFKSETIYIYTHIWSYMIVIDYMIVWSLCHFPPAHVLFQSLIIGCGWIPPWPFQPLRYKDNWRDCKGEGWETGGFRTTPLCIRNALWFICGFWGCQKPWVTVVR